LFIDFLFYVGNLMKFSRDVGINWHLRFRQEIQKLTEENEKLKIQNNILRRKLIKQYENDRARSTRNREDDNIVKFSRPVHPTGD